MESTPERSPRPPRWAWGAVGGIALVALALRFAHLDAVALWYDEGFGFLMARLPWGEMNRALLMDVHPPLWFWFVHAVPTESVLSARISGALLGALTPVLLWCAVRRSVGDVAALLAAALLTVHPLHVFHSQELRMYALLGVLIVGLLAAAISDRGWITWVALSVAAAVVMATHYLGGAVVGGVWLGLLLARGRSADRAWLLGWLLSGAAALVFPLVWLFASDWSGAGLGHGTMPLGLRTLRDALEGTQGLVRCAPWEWIGMHGGTGMWSRALAALVLVLAVSGARVLITDPSRRGVGLVFAGALFGGLALLILYQLAGLLFFTRFYVVLLIPAVILMGAALSTGPRWWRIGGAAVIAVGLASHSAAVIRANGQVRDVTHQIERFVLARGGPEAIPPMLCAEAFLGVPLHALIREADVRVLDRADAISPAQRAILGEDGLAASWPEGWEHRPVWIALSGWGGAPGDESEVRRRTQEVLQVMETQASVRRILPPFRVLGGFKWAIFVEVGESGG